MRAQLQALVEQMIQGGILYHEAIREFKKSFIAAALSSNNGNYSRTARTLGVHRNTLTRAMRELGIPGKRRRPPQRAFSPGHPKTKGELG